MLFGGTFPILSGFCHRGLMGFIPFALLAILVVEHAPWFMSRVFWLWAARVQRADFSLIQVIENILPSAASLAKLTGLNADRDFVLGDGGGTLADFSV